jgi:hypothetical protein
MFQQGTESYARRQTNPEYRRRTIRRSGPAAIDHSAATVGFNGRMSDGVGLPEGTPEIHLRVGKVRRYHRVTRPKVWPLRGISYEGSLRGAPMRIRKKLMRFLIPQ